MTGNLPRAVWPQQGTEGLGVIGCNSCLHKAALRCTACMVCDGRASCLGLIFISSLCTSLGTNCPVLVTGHLPLCPPRQELCVWGWPGHGELARRSLRNTGLPEFLSQKALWGSSHTKPRCGRASPAPCHPSLEVAIPVQGSWKSCSSAGREISPLSSLWLSTCSDT